MKKLQNENIRLMAASEQNVKKIYYIVAQIKHCVRIAIYKMKHKTL